jgi:RNA polymerase sigma factor (sigma-70 family)
MGAITQMAKVYLRATTFIEFEDLIQEGSMGLLHATSLYDETVGTKFITYATWHIRARIRRAVQNAHIIHLPALLLESCREDADRARNVTRYGDRDRTNPLETLPSRETLPEVGEDELESLRKAIATLPPVQRMVIQERLLEGKKLKELGKKVKKRSRGSPRFQAVHDAEANGIRNLVAILTGEWKEEELDAAVKRVRRALWHEGGQRRK